MSRDKRKDLRLVKPKPPTEAEVDRAAEALRAALSPDGLDSADHEALLAMVLGDEAAEVSPSERAAAEALRIALDQGADHPLAELAESLRAVERGALGEDDHEALVALSLGLDLPEHDESRKLAEALAGQGRHPLADFATAMRCAQAPSALASPDAEALLCLSLGTESAFDDEELREAAALRDALAGQGDHPLGRWAIALRAAAGRLGGIDDLRHERILRRALRGAAARPGVVITTLIAVAAAVALFVGSWQESAPPDAPVAARAGDLVVARSTQALFDPTVPFGPRGGESDRMDRIVEARAADLRANRFAVWGVR